MGGCLSDTRGYANAQHRGANFELYGSLYNLLCDLKRFPFSQRMKFPPIHRLKFKKKTKKTHPIKYERVQWNVLNAFTTAFCLCETIRSVSSSISCENLLDGIELIFHIVSIRPTYIPLWCIHLINSYWLMIVTPYWSLNAKLTFSVPTLESKDIQPPSMLH